MSPGESRVSVLLEGPPNIEKFLVTIDSFILLVGLDEELSSGTGSGMILLGLRTDAWAGRV